MTISKDIFKYSHANFWIDILTRTKIRFTRGQFWMYFLKDLLLFGIGFNVFISTLSGVVIFGHSMASLQQYAIWMYIFGPIAYLVGGYVAGYIDENAGIWKAENAYSTCVLNPEGIEWQMDIIRTIVKEEINK